MADARLLAPTDEKLLAAARPLVGALVVSVPAVGWAIDVGVALSAPHLVGLALIAFAAIVTMRTNRRVPMDLAVLSVLAYFGVAVLTVIRVQMAPDIHLLGESAHWKSIKQLVGLAYGTALFIALYGVMVWCNLGTFALRLHYWTVAVCGIAMLGQFAVASVDLSSPLANFPVSNSTMGDTRPLSLMYGFPRVSLTLVEPSMLATYLLTGWAVWLFAIDRPRDFSARAPRAFVWSGVALSVAVVVTGSRLAYVTFALLTAGALLVRGQRPRRIGLVGLGAVVGLALTGPANVQAVIGTLVPDLTGETAPSAPPEPPASPVLVDAPAVPVPSDERPAPDVTLLAVVQGSDQSVQQRMVSYLVAMAVIRDHPFLGTGFGTSALYMERDWPATFSQLPPDRVAPATMMGQYATVLTETGLAGMACLGCFALGLAWRLWRAVRSGEADIASRGRAMCGAVGVYAISSAGTALVVYQILLVWLLLAMALAVTTSDGSQRSADGRELQLTR